MSSGYVPVNPAARPRRDARAWQLKFYADSKAESIVNKLFSFYVEDGAAAARLLDRFLFNGWRFRAVWLVHASNPRNSGRVPDGLLNELARHGFADSFTAQLWYDAFPKFM